MQLILLPRRYAVCQPDSPPAPAGSFFSITRTDDELSVICEERLVPPGARQEPGWRVLRIAGKLEFTQVGVLASVLNPLKEAGVTILAVATFDTDYVLVREVDLGRSRAALASAGHELADG